MQATEEFAELSSSCEEVVATTLCCSCYPKFREDGIILIKRCFFDPLVSPCQARPRWAGTTSGQ